jgi:hypothetical protein
VRGIVVAMRPLPFLIVGTLAAVACNTASAQGLEEEVSEGFRLPTTVYLAAASVDVATTAYCVSAGCLEGNPAVAWMQSRSAVGMLAAGEAADMAGLWAWRTYVGRRNPALAKLGMYAVAAVRLGLAARNVREGRKQRRFNAGSTQP